MKTDLLVLAGTVLLFATLPVVSHAGEDDDRAILSPLAVGEPMEDCDILHQDTVLAIQPVPPFATGKVEAILATPDVAPAVIVPAVPVKAPPGSTTQASPRPLSPATLLTFALIASPGTALLQTGGPGRD